MTDWLLEEIANARRERKACAIVTVAATKGSVPRVAGSKMLVYATGKTVGTIGGGKFESLVVADTLAGMKDKEPRLRTYPLHEHSPESFGAIWGGEATVLIEPQLIAEAIFLFGAGHCSLAIAKLAANCGLFVTVIEDRTDQLALFPPAVEKVSDVAPPAFIAAREWKGDEAIVLVSRNYQLDRDALRAALRTGGAGYIGMIGSDRKVHRVFDELSKEGISAEQLAKVYAPVGLDVGADSPEEIAISVVAEILKVLRDGTGDHLRQDRTRTERTARGIT